MTRLAKRPSERGVALLVAAIAMSMLSVLGMALALSASVDRLASTNYDSAIELANFAESALELAAGELGTIADWTRVLTGEVQASRVDGFPEGTRQPFAGLVVDLTSLTNQLTCGAVSSCPVATVQVSTAERPWGANNPQWRPFLYDILRTQGPRGSRSAYVVVLVGDDGSEVDGNPRVDGGGPEAEGRYIVRAHAVAFGREGGRHAIEAELARSCPNVEDEEPCVPGIRVQSWHLVAGAAP